MLVGTVDTGLLQVKFASGCAPRPSEAPPPPGGGRRAETPRVSSAAQTFSTARVSRAEQMGGLDAGPEREGIFMSERPRSYLIPHSYESMRQWIGRGREVRRPFSSSESRSSEQSVLPADCALLKTGGISARCLPFCPVGLSPGLVGELVGIRRMVGGSGWAAAELTATTRRQRQRLLGSRLTLDCGTVWHGFWHTGTVRVTRARVSSPPRLLRRSQRQPVRPNTPRPFLTHRPFMRH
jgi:hypothetical protein